MAKKLNVPIRRDSAYLNKTYMNVSIFHEQIIFLIRDYQFLWALFWDHSFEIRQFWDSLPISSYIIFIEIWDPDPKLICFQNLYEIRFWSPFSFFCNLRFCSNLILSINDLKLSKIKCYKSQTLYVYCVKNVRIRPSL